MAAASDPARRRRAARERHGSRGPRLIAYFDSSAFVKLLLLEPGTDHAREVFFSARRVRSSRVLIPEAHAAVARARRTLRIGPRAASRALDVARTLLDQVEPIELHPVLADRAAQLAAEHGLRGFDAIHLASYERTATHDSLFVAADGELVRAAAAGGHATAPLGR